MTNTFLFVFLFFLTIQAHAQSFNAEKTYHEMNAPEVEITPRPTETRPLIFYRLFKKEIENLVCERKQNLYPVIENHYRCTFTF